MPSKFDAAVDRMHAIADSWFADDATFRPAAGGAHACKLERALPALDLGLSEARAVVGDVVLRVLKSALPVKPVKGDVFEVGAEDYRVLASPTVEDDDGKRWTIQAEKIAS